MYKWTRTAQTCVVQGSAVQSSNWREKSYKGLNTKKHNFFLLRSSFMGMWATQPHGAPHWEGPLAWVSLSCGLCWIEWCTWTSGDSGACAELNPGLLAPPPAAISCYRLCSWYRVPTSDWVTLMCNFANRTSVSFLCLHKYSLPCRSKVGREKENKRKQWGRREGNLTLPPTSSHSSQGWKTDSNMGAPRFASLSLSFLICKVGIMRKSPFWAPQRIKWDSAGLDSVPGIEGVLSKWCFYSSSSSSSSGRS